MLISCSETVGIQNFQGPVTYSMFLVMITKPHTFIFCNIFLMVLTFCFLRLQISVFLRVAGTQMEKLLFHTILKEKALKGLHAPTVCALLLLCIASREALKKIFKKPSALSFLVTSPYHVGGQGSSKKRALSNCRQPQQFFSNLNLAMTTLHQHLFYTAASCIGKHPRVLHQCKPKNINIFIKIIHELLVITKNIHSHAHAKTSSKWHFLSSSYCQKITNILSSKTVFQPCLFQSFKFILHGHQKGGRFSEQCSDIEHDGKDCNRLGRKRPLVIPVRANYLDFNNENGRVKNANLIKGWGWGGCFLSAVVSLWFLDGAFLFQTSEVVTVI